jgi:hypothetical protein
MTRIALISDIHADEAALRAVLADIRRTGVDQVICLGDVATLGPRPNAVIEILGELGCRCIMGNHDEFLLDAELVHTYSGAPQVVASIDWTRCRLSRIELHCAAAERPAGSRCRPVPGIFIGPIVNGLWGLGTALFLSWMPGSAARAR